MKKTFALTALALALAACTVNQDDAATVLPSEPEAQTAVTIDEDASSAPEKREVAGKGAGKLQPKSMMADSSHPVAAQRLAPSIHPQGHYHHRLPDYHLPPQGDRERYEGTADNPVKRVVDDPLSTFSIDVDAASFTVARRYLNEGRLPPVDAIRTEEIINALAYQPLAGLNKARPVGVETRIFSAPWNTATRLLQVRLNAWEPQATELPDSNYVFLIDVSGSMQGEDRIGLLKRAFAVMLGKLKPTDTVALVTYASGSRTVLEPTKASEKQVIQQALAALTAGGSTHASDGIQRAYRLAEQALIKGGNNRVILATDGDVNVGLQGDALVDLIETKRDAGIYLTVLGVGRGNYMDAQLEPLANKGDGNYYYLDGFKEAQRVLVNGLKGTAYTVAKDVKLQVEFNPAVVAEYRLIGYNNRQLQHADFNNDAKGAGDIGAGHSVTALYEITLANSGFRFIDDRRYGATRLAHGNTSELALVKLRYKSPEGGNSVRRDHVVYSRELAEVRQANAAVVAAGFAEKLRGSSYVKGMDWAGLQSLLGALDLSRENHTDLKEMVEMAAVLAATNG